MLIPEQTMLMIDGTTLDVTDSRESGQSPSCTLMVLNFMKKISSFAKRI